MGGCPGQNLLPRHSREACTRWCAERLKPKNQACAICSGSRADDCLIKNFHRSFFHTFHTAARSSVRQSSPGLDGRQCAAPCFMQPAASPTLANVPGLLGSPYQISTDHFVSWNAETLGEFNYGHSLVLPHHASGAQTRWEWSNHKSHTGASHREPRGGSL